MFILSFFSRVGSLSLQWKINEEGSSWLGSPLSWALLTRRMTTVIVLALSAVYYEKPGCVISSVLLLKKRSQMLFVHEKKNKKSFKMNQGHTKQPLATDVPHIPPSFLPVQMNDCRKQCSNYSLQERLWVFLHGQAWQKIIKNNFLPAQLVFRWNYVVSFEMILKEKF